MNKTVEYVINNIPNTIFGRFVIRAYQYAPEAYEKNKEYHKQNGKIPNPIELAKYAIKIYSWLPGEEEKVSLNDLQEINDPLQVTEFCKFSNKFSYSEQKSAFVPMGVTIEGSHLMKDIWDSLESKRVAKAWEKAQPYLQTPDGSAPSLSYTFDS